MIHKNISICHMMVKRLFLLHTALSAENFIVEENLFNVNLKDKNIVVTFSATVCSDCCNFCCYDLRQVCNFCNCCNFGCDFQKAFTALIPSELDPLKGYVYKMVLHLKIPNLNYLSLTSTTLDKIFGTK